MILDRLFESASTMHSPTRALPPSIAALLLSLALVGPAASAEKARPATAAKPPEQRVLTPSQLKDCIDQKARLQAQTEAALKAKSDITAEKEEIDRSGTALANELEGLDRTSADAVNAHNAKIDERDKRIEAYQSRVTVFNSEAENVRSTHDAYAKACENRRYDERDLPVAPKKK